LRRKGSGSRFTEDTCKGGAREKRPKICGKIEAGEAGGKVCSISRPSIRGDGIAGKETEHDITETEVAPASSTEEVETGITHVCTDLRDRSGNPF
jgi:hypothetical protein